MVTPLLSNPLHMPDRSCETNAKHPKALRPDGFDVKIRRLPARSVAYIRVLDSFRDGAVRRAAEQLAQWAEARGLADGHSGP